MWRDREAVGRRERGEEETLGKKTKGKRSNSGGRTKPSNAHSGRKFGIFYEENKETNKVVIAPE